MQAVLWFNCVKLKYFSIIQELVWMLLREEVYSVLSVRFLPFSDGSKNFFLGRSTVSKLRIVRREGLFIYFV